MFEASNAVDGDKSKLTASVGQCTKSSSHQTATWWVNLTSVHIIHHITIYFRAGKKPWMFSNFLARSILGFSLYVSNTTERLEGILCFKDKNFTRESVPVVFTTTCPTHGQYVIYYNERLTTVNYPAEYSTLVDIDLCEVEVYGCPSTGLYGHNCSIPCPDINCKYCHTETGTCQGCKPGYKGHRCELVCAHGLFGQDCANKCNDKCDGCNNVNGLCDSGCQPGWTGIDCRTECTNGWYGIGCNETCGHCRQLNQCSHSNGTCLTGCDTGYQGDLCKSPSEKTLYQPPTISNISQSIAAVILLIIAFFVMILYKRSK